MARPQEYNKEQVLEASMRLFWRQGYKATNMTQLLACTELSRSSLYSSFGDKRQLFVESLSLYAQKLAPKLNAVSKSLNPAEAVYLYLRPFYDESLPPPPENGCLLGNSLVEFEDVDDELYHLTREYSRKKDEAFKDCFTRALQQGQLDTQHTAEELTLLFSTLNAGIHIKRRTGIDKKQIRMLVDFFVRSIGCKTIENVDDNSVCPLSVSEH